jgi:hypothetical protein
MKRVGEIKKAIIEKPIYRIDSLDRFYEILDKRALTFIRPTKWCDPLENIVFNAKMLRDGKEYEHPGKSKIYAQCWTRESDSYALWQIYAKDQPGIRMETRFDNLRIISAKNNGEFYYGMVQYLYKKDLDALPQNKALLKGISSEKISEQHIKTLLIKRKSYRYEKEIRFFALSNASIVDRTDDDLARIKIDPLLFFSSLRFDPRFTYSGFEQHKARLIKQYGFRKDQITLSTLSQSNRLCFVIS